MQLAPITDLEIDWAESRMKAVGLLPQNESFDTGRREVIKCLESKDVVACPGSGKTTSLVAKLLILAQRLPFAGNRGVCVLSHTNVAVDEIKERLFDETSALFRYPNFVGTVQNFVDAFLAAPALSAKLGVRPKYFDDDLASERIKKEFRKWAWSGNVNANSTEEQVESSKARGKIWQLAKDREDLHSDQNKRSEIYITELTFSPDLVQLVNTKTGAPIKVNAGTATGRTFKRSKGSAYTDGILSYNDAYIIALSHLKRFPEIKQAFQARFKFVFIDEAQDLDPWQLKLLNELFEDTTCSGTITQFIGDPDQAIFSSYEGENCLWQPRPGYLSIDDSKRFCNAIAAQVSKFRLDRGAVVGNSDLNREEPKTYVLLYTDETIERVKDKFGELIVQHGLHVGNEAAGKPFKAVGWIKRSKAGNISIGSYFGAGYSPETSVKRPRFERPKNLQAQLTDYLALPPEKQTSGAWWKLLLGVIREAFYLSAKWTAEGKYFSQPSLLSWLKEEQHLEPLRLKAITWHGQLAASPDVLDSVLEEVKAFIVKELLQKDASQPPPELSSLFAAGSVQTTTSGAVSAGSMYLYSDGSNNQIAIEFDSVHGVKGETHSATCYLETTHRGGSDFKRLKSVLTGKAIKQKPLCLQNAKLAYVGISRPKHLLCVALHAGHAPTREELELAGWVVV
ncbi:MAG: UvrD-helicase domain-containing protein [Bacteroidia bacterium]|nr:UvrD-helicase domain-containing protein [Bacteroidia bacterium]